MNIIVSTDRYIEAMKQRLNEIGTELAYQIIHVDSAIRFESFVQRANEEDLELFYSDITGGKLYPKQLLICVMKRRLVDSLCKDAIAPSSPTALVDALSNSQWSNDESAHIVQLYSSDQQTRQRTLAAVRSAFGTQILSTQTYQHSSGIFWRIAIVANEVLSTAQKHPLIVIKN